MTRLWLDIDWDRRGYVTFDEFLAGVPALRHCPFQDRLARVLDTAADHRLDFAAFARALAIFSEHASQEQKIHFAFRLYDIDDDGALTREELSAFVSQVCV